MAKKKKRTSKAKGGSKKSKAEVSEPNYFRRQVSALLMILLALFIGIGAFGLGGDDNKLFTSIFDGASYLFGFVAFILPLVLIYLAVHKLRHEEYKIPLKQKISSVVLLISLSGMLHVVVDPDEASSAAQAGTWGGQVGNFVSSLFLSLFNQATAMVILLVIALIALLIMFNASPKQLIVDLLDSFKKEEDTDLEDIQDEDKPKKLKLNANVPVEHQSDYTDEPEEKLSKGPRHATFKNTAAPIAINDNHAALVTESDPNWKIPPISLLSAKQEKADPGDVEGNADRIKQALGNFGIEVEMEDANIGSRVTQYTMRAPQGVKMNKIANLADNIAYELEAHTVRIEAPIPGKKAVGIEVPNKRSANVTLRSLIKRPEWLDKKGALTFAVGQDIAGNPVYGDLAAMPHVLIAGQTKSGKSVMVNTLLTSLLYRNSPSDLKLILVDPKYVELEPYNDIPHLLTPVINDPEKCISALKWAVAEMDRRYRAVSKMKLRDIEAYNEAMPLESMPYIVIVIDELSDLMQMAARDVEALIVRIAQKARAVGIHLVLATQRPSVDVITGLIKANIPARIAFTVTSQVDSRTIIDQVGAEKLLGMGDMLYSTTDIPKPVRVQGAFISTDETNKVTDYLRDQQQPKYDNEVISLPVQFNGRGGIVPDTGSAGTAGGSDDGMFKDAVGVVIGDGKASTSLLQRRLRIGYGRASRIIDEMEERGIIGHADGSRPREVLVSSIEEALGVSDGPVQIEVSDDPRDEYLTR